MRSIDPRAVVPATGRVDRRGDAADLIFAVDPCRGLRRMALEELGEDFDVVVQLSGLRPQEGAARRRHGFDDDHRRVHRRAWPTYAGIKAQIAAVTEAAMRGELDFAEALDARVALLKGSRRRPMIDRCRAERVRIMPGAKALVRTMKARRRAHRAGLGRLHRVRRAGCRRDRLRCRDRQPAGDRRRQCSTGWLRSRSSMPRPSWYARSSANGPRSALTRIRDAGGRRRRQRHSDDPGGGTGCRLPRQAEDGRGGCGARSIMAI